MDIIDNKALLVRTKNPQRIIDAITKSKLLGEESEGVYKVLVHWGLPEASKLASLVQNVPSPITKEYDWPGLYKPFAHQRKTAEFLSLRHKAFCFSEQGTGKTASAIWAADYLMRMGLVRRVLVICPLSIMRSAWQADLFKFAVHRKCDVAHGSRETRIAVVNSEAEFVIVNYDGVEIIADALTKDGTFDLIIIDEASGYKNAQTTRWKVLKNLITPTMRVWMMTGTPAAQSPVDAYGLAKIVNPTGTPKFFGQYRDMVMVKLGQFRWVPRPQAEKVVHSILQPAIRFEKKDCLDLPPVTFVTRDAPLTSQQMGYYKLLKSKMEIEAAGETITAANAATNMNKLLQISCGSIYTDDGNVVDFDVNNRLSVVEEVINESSHKVLVFVPFTHTIELLSKHLKKSGITAEIINGNVPLNRRSAIFDKFQNTPDPKVLVIQPQAAAHGLTLTAADTIIWYAPVTSVETYLQANARIDRPGQVNPMTVVHITGSDVEAKIYNMLRNNINVHGKIIDLYRETVLTEK
jgi:SNF2 family DNA or RNA helicase